MATIIGNDLPPLPPGFVIGDLPVQQAAIPAVPPGFVIEEPTTIQAPQREEKGFFGRTAEKLRERGAKLADIFTADISGEQTTPETIFQTVGTEIGAIGDIIGEGVLSAAKATPETIKQPIVAGVRNLLNTDSGKAAIEALSKGVENWESFKKDNPRAARNIEATFNVGTAFTPIKGVSAAKLAKGGIGKGIGNVKRITTKAPVITSDDVSVLASASYKKAEELGGTLTPEFTNQFIADIEKLTPQTEIGKIVGGESPFTKTVEQLQQIKDKPISLEAAQEFDELLGDTVDSLMDQGRLTKQARKVLQIQDRFREGIEKAEPSLISGGKEGFNALKEGRKLWAASRKLKDVERIIARAELIDNPATAIKTGFRNLVTNPKRVRGFTKKEIALMRKAAKTGIVSDILRVTLGSRLIPIFTAATGGGLGTTAAATAGSIAARGIAERATAGRAAAVAQEIAKRAIQ